MSSQIAIITFDSEDKAKEVYESLKKMQKEKLIDLKEAVIVDKDEKGKLKVKESVEFSKKRGAVTGGALGFIIGLMIGGPIGGMLLGGVAGYFTGKKLDFGISKDKIDAVSADMANSSSALFLQFESIENKAAVSALMRDSGGKLYEFDLSDDHEADIDDALAGTVARH